MNNNDLVTVRQTSSSGYSTATSTTLDIGGVSDTFTVTTEADTTPDPTPDPFTFDPQFVGSPMGDLISFAVESRGIDILRDPVQQTWAEIEIEWRVAMKVELLSGREGSWGAEWGAAIIVFFVLLAILLALLKRRQKRRAATRRPTPPPDETLFESQHE